MVNLWLTNGELVANWSLDHGQTAAKIWLSYAEWWLMFDWWQMTIDGSWSIIICHKQGIGDWRETMLNQQIVTLPNLLALDSDMHQEFVRTARHSTWSSQLQMNRGWTCPWTISSFAHLQASRRREDRPCHVGRHESHGRTHQDIARLEACSTSASKRS